MRETHSLFRQLSYWYWRRFVRRAGKRPPRLGAAMAGVTTILIGVMFVAAALVSKVTGVRAEKPSEPEPLVIQKMGSLFAGGSVISSPGTYSNLDPSNPAGQTLHVDHTYAQYHIPANARKLPLVMWHGCYSVAWESTPDGRESFEPLFLRRGFGVYVLDQPRQGRAGKSSQGFTTTVQTGDQAQFTRFRIGLWPDYYPGVQFPRDAASLEHWLRQSGAANGPGSQTLSVAAGVALFAKIGPAVLVNHSAGGLPGWLTASQSANVRGIVSYEPTGFVFPTGEVPAPIATPLGPVTGTPVSPADFQNLTKIPIQVVYGDNIPWTVNPIPGPDLWRARRELAYMFVAAVNRHGGDAQLLSLPDIGVYGNTHFVFTDLNNVKIADLMSKFLHEKGLDKRGKGQDKD
jgi:hypothetical protein